MDERLRATAVPFAGAAGDAVPPEPVTVGDLIDVEALGVRALNLGDPHDRDDLVDGYQHEVWVGDEAQLHYDDDDARRALDESLARQAGIDGVSWEDREILRVKAPTLCTDGVLAAVAMALLDAEVRAPRSAQLSVHAPSTTTTSAATERPPLFDVLSRTEAKDYLARFVDELPASRARLADKLTATGGDPGLADNQDPVSLDLLWETVIQGWDLSYQDDYVPNPHPAGAPLHEATWEALGPIEELPSWFAHDWGQFIRFSPDTLWTIDVLGRHLGQMLLHHHPDLGWMVGPDRPASNVDRSRPVVGKGRNWVNTFRRTSVLIARTMRGEHPPTAYFTTLRGLYERMEKEVA